MKKHLCLRELVLNARSEPVPHLDVADDVISVLESGQPLGSCRPLMWIASVSSVAAACVAIASFLAVKASASNAMSGMYEVISWAAQ